MEDYKARVANAIAGFFERQDKKQKGPSRKNQKPEKQTEKECLDWMREQKFDVQIVEAKSVFSRERGRFISQSVKAGTVDCIGNDPQGFGVFVEFKAPGRLSTLRDAQRKFLIKKIHSGAFACVTDSAKRLADIYHAWCKFRREGKLDQSKLFLVQKLPHCPRYRTAASHDKLFENDTE